MTTMKLTEALRISNAARKAENGFTVSLATGFMPLILSQFLAAHLSQKIAGYRIDVSTGSFGDIVGNIERITQSHADLAAICVEWEDLDPRLGVRRLVATTWKDFPDILVNANNAKDHLLRLIQAACADRRVAVSLPHLPIPPLSYLPAHLIGEFEAQLKLIAAQMQVELTRVKNVRVLRQGSSPCFDFSATLNIGFPYTIEHASELGKSLAAALATEPPKKGIIVDLDDTLWQGILGDAGADGVHWDLDHHAQHHGLFQRLLHTLAAEGTLVAIASKNSPEAVREIFDCRPDLLLRAEDVFPIEVHWRSKAESVKRILLAWNVAADAVIFVDDSPMELAEVEAAHPGIACRSFPTHDLAQFECLIKELRTAFAKELVGEEDALRANSLRANSRVVEEAGATVDPEKLLRDLQAELTFELGADASDVRALELVNKTNQFNLNGMRVAEPLWRKAFARRGAFLLTCTYKDKFGALGKIAVLTGVAEADHIVVECWVMSCRAFARRIEFACVQQLFNAFSANQIVLHYRRTERNSPLKSMLESLEVTTEQDGETVLLRELFAAKVPTLYHSVCIHRRKPEVETYA